MSTDHTSPVSPEPQSSDTAGGTEDDAHSTDATPHRNDETDSRSPDTGAHESTGVPTGTTPRAVLRPVPDEFPTPPPRPARPNRAPALPQPEATAPKQPRYLVPLIVGISVFVLVLGIIGSLTAVRLLSSSEQSRAADTPSPNTTSEASSDPAANRGTAPLALGEITVSEVSTQSAVAKIGTGSGTLKPQGEYIVLTLEIRNDSDSTVVITSTTAQLETVDGELHSPSHDASEALDTTTEPRGTADPGDVVQVNAVFDVPSGSQPVAAHIDLSNNRDDAIGVLSLDG